METADLWLFYNKSYDDLRRSGMDVIKNGNTDDVHFSRAFPNGIPKKVWDEMQKCPSFVENE